MPTSARREQLLRQLLAADQRPGRDRISRATRRPGEDLPLSFAQERLWLVDQLTGGSSAYNIPHMVRFRGVLRVEALEWALGEVVRRHEVLRTCYPVVGGRVVQRVVDGGFRLGFRDLSGVVDGWGVVGGWAVGEAVEGFDLSVGPVVRGELVRLAVDDHVLLLTVHHIASDGWSSGVLVREVLALYEGFGRGVSGDEVLGVLGVQYGDFAVWQRGWLRGEVLAGELGFWRERLAGVGLLRLPFDRPRPTALSGAGKTIRFPLGDALRARLLAFAAAEGVTPFMVLVTAFDTLLYRLTGQTDIAIGTQIANRQRPELESVIGFFVNTLVLRTDLAGEPTFREALHRVRRTTVDAYAHQDVPFEQVVQDLHPDRDLSQPLPLFNVDCMLQNAPFPRRRLPDVDVELIDRHTWTAKSDLGLMFWDYHDETRSELIGWAEYSTDLFDDSTIERIVDEFVRVLDAGIEAPQTKVSRLALLSAAEEHTQLVRWSPLPSWPPIERTALDLWDEAVRSRGDTPAVIAGQSRISYRELDRRANALAHRLIGAGAQADRVVAVLAERDVDTFVAIIGVFKAGAAFVLIDPTDPEPRVARMLAEARPSVLVRAAAGGDRVTVADVAVVEIPMTGDQEPTPPRLRHRGDQLAYVMFTSGSTGVPKGAMVEHQGLVNLADWLADTIYRTENGSARTGCFNADFTSDAFVEDLCLLLQGETMILPDAFTRRDPRLLSELLRGQRVELFQCSPTQVRQLADAGLFAPGCPLRRLIVAGEKIDEELWHQLAGYPEVQVWNVYGPAECAVDATFTRVLPGVPASIGRPVHNAIVRILDGSGAIVPVSVAGEICLGGVPVGRGYLGRPRQTAAVFVPDPYAPTPGARLYRTGDIGSYRPDGSIVFHGRRDDQVKIRGFRVELGEVQAALQEITTVGQAHVELDRRHGEARLVAYVTPRVEEVHPERVTTELIDLWRRVFDVEQAPESPDATLDTSGWNDSSSFLPIAEDEMRAYRDATVAAIAELRPRRVLEVGCGTGLILFGLVDLLTAYVGVDFSPVTVAKLRAAVDAAALPFPVRLVEAEAADLGKVSDAMFDTVVANSVVQYLPHLDHLTEVVVAAMDRLDGAGTVFLGDLRSPELLRLTHVWIEAGRAAPETTVAELGRLVDNAMSRERELLVPVQYLEQLARTVPGIAQVRHQLHPGVADNEMVRFRYDAVLYRQPPVRRVTPDFVAWTPELTLAGIEQAVVESPAAVLAWSGIANERLVRERRLAAVLDAASDSAAIAGTTIAEAALRFSATVPSGLDPQQLLDLAARHGRQARLTWTPGRLDGCFDLVLLTGDCVGRQIEVSYPPAAPAPSAGPSPQRTHLHHKLRLAIRDELAQRLPEHMVPAAIVVLDRMPINAAGKVDRVALPDPDLGRPLPNRYDGPPRTATEKELAAIWRRLLDVPAVSATDNFFLLGGHSLLATTMVNRASAQLGAELGIRDAFQYPVLRDLAAVIDRSTAGHTAAPPLLPVLRDEYLPLSFTQERFWLAEQTSRQRGLYNIPHMVRFRGVLRVEALEWALGEVVRRHEVLRTCYPVVGGRVVQRVVDGGFRLGFRDLSGVVDGWGVVGGWAVGEAVEGFDLSVGPVVRGELVRLAVDDHVLLLTVHHIASDGWSSGVLVREVLALYEGFGRGVSGDEVLGVLGVQYGDFAVWQRGWLRGEVLAGELGFWRERLAGVGLLRLPFDRPRPTAPGPTGTQRTVTVGTGLYQRAAAFAAAEGVTPFIVLLTAFTLVLREFSGQADIAIGTIVAGRERAGTEALIGAFVNTLILRTDLTAVETPRDALRRVRRSALDAYAHQNLPFEQLSAELGGVIPDIVFQLDDSAAALPQLPDLAVESVQLLRPTAKFALAVTALPQPDGGLALHLEYLADLVEERDIDRLTRTFETTVDQLLLGTPDSSLTPTGGVDAA